MTGRLGDAICGEIDAMAGMLSALRRHLHRHPEPSREEFGTAGHLASVLADAGVPHRLIPSGRGVIAGDDAPRGGPLVAIRGDIDALRIQDAKDVPYRSTRDGLMHACGHDAHATMALGAAIALHRAGVPFRALLQPAEEVGEGADEMVACGAIDGVAAILALHVDPETDVGRVAWRAGVLTASCQTITASIVGRGGHAARPHLTADPIEAAALFVSAVYQGLPRAIDARRAAVVSFGAISGGTSPNVIPDRVDLQGTIRTTDPDDPRRIRDRLGRIARGIAMASEVEITLEFDRETAAVVNDPTIADAFAKAAARVVGPSNVLPIPLPSLGAEDFSGYLDRVPGCMLRLGVGTGPAPRPGLHNPRFDIDERALTIGAKVLAQGVLDVGADLRARGISA